MYAIRQHRFGAPDTIVFEEVADPVPGPGQVRIRVAAAGVHLIDGSIRRGESGGPFPLPTLPTTPGREVAGVVDAVGEGIDPAWLGRRTVAHLGQASGGYAELAVREVDAVHAIPEGVSDDHAVAMTGTGRTTLGILETAPIAPTDVVVVPAAAGGIGALLVQAALEADALVVGLAGGPEKVARIQVLGAQITLDYTAPDWAEALAVRLDGMRPSLVFDTVGGDVGHALLKMLRPGGHHVIAGWSAGAPTALTGWDVIGGGITVSSAMGARMTNRPGGIRGLELASLAAVAARRLVPLVNPPFALRDAAAAHTAMEARATVGKVVLHP